MNPDLENISLTNILVILVDSDHQGLKSLGSMAAVLPGRKLTDRTVARKEGASACSKGPCNIERKLRTSKLIRYQAKIAGQVASKPGS